MDSTFHHTVGTKTANGEISLSTQDKSSGNCPFKVRHILREVLENVYIYIRAAVAQSV
jgi:hypothetical protein